MRERCFGKIPISLLHRDLYRIAGGTTAVLVKIDPTV